MAEREQPERIGVEGARGSPPPRRGVRPDGAEVGSWASQDDGRLMTAVGRKSPDALAELHRRHGGAMAAVIGRMGLGSDADDVVQEVFLRLWQRPERFDPTRGELRSFLMLQARGRAIDMWRSDSARRAREHVEPDRRFAPSPPADDDALARLSTEQSLVLLDCLSPLERDAIALAFYGGHTYHEVAGLLGAPEGTIKSRIRTGLTRLRRELTERSPDPIPG